VTEGDENMAGVAAVAHDSFGVDTNAKLTAQSAQQLAAATYQGSAIEFIARYVSLGAPSPGDITGDEVNAILAAGLALLLVQHVRNPGWTPSGAQGTSDGQHAAAHASSVGYAAGAHLVMDLEGVAAGTPAQAVIDHVNGWASAVIQAGYQAMLYVGYEAILTPQQLYEALPDIHRYWSDFGNRSVATRGFCMKQVSGTTHLAGVPFGIDPDQITADAKGDRPTWMEAS
jgi:hypothetical protein